MADRFDFYTQYTVKKGDALPGVVERYKKGELNNDVKAPPELTWKQVWSDERNTLPGRIHDPEKGGVAARVKDDPNRIYAGEIVELPVDHIIAGTKVVSDLATIIAAVPVTAEIKEIAGLYKPGYNDPIDEAHNTTKLSGYQKGYKSEDDKGRIFINHIPLLDTRTADPAEDWQKTWKKDTQYIDLTVEVFPNTATLPADAKIIWEWEDPDDPSNKDMRTDAGKIIDPNDYVGDTYNGDNPDDNEGKHDHPSPDSDKGLKFEENTSYTLSAGAKPTQCETLIANRISKVRLHYTNVGGDNFKVRVRLKDHPAIKVSKGDGTGVMTIWKRIDVEYVKMKGARDLPIKDVPKHFEKAFVQIDFTESREVKPDPFGSDKYLSLTEANFDGGDPEKYVKKAPPGEFKNEGKPGWFLLASALEAHPLGGDKSEKLFDSATEGEADLVDYTYGDGTKTEFLVLPKHVTKKVDTVEILEVTGGGEKVVEFVVRRDLKVGAKHYIDLRPMDYQPDFKPGKGSLDEAYNKRYLYYPGHMWEVPPKTWHAGGYGFTGKIKVRVRSPGSWATSGISPTNEHGGKDYFAGRTIIFSKHGAYHEFDDKGSRIRTSAQVDAKILGTIVHEFTHAFGFPHKCGYHDFTKPDGRSCTMNYRNVWIFKIGTKTPDRFNTGQASANLCAQHIDGIRKAHLEDNPALWTW